MNTITGAWCNYTGWNSNCMEMYLDEPYFGGNGYVARAYIGNTDNGSNIQALGFQAFNNFTNGGKLKRFTMSRPILRADGQPSVYVGINIDFDTSDTTAPLNYSAVTSGIWDTTLWDAGTWGTVQNVIQNWQGLNGVGYYGAPVVKVLAAKLNVSWVSTDVVIESGGIL
jgi:hypothetical protein